MSTPDKNQKDGTSDRGVDSAEHLPTDEQGTPESESEYALELLSDVRATLEAEGEVVNHAAQAIVDFAIKPLSGDGMEEGGRIFRDIQEFQRAVYGRDEAVFQFEAFFSTAKAQQAQIESMALATPIDFQKLEALLASFYELLAKAHQFLDRAHTLSRQIANGYSYLRIDHETSHPELVEDPQGAVVDLTKKRDAVQQRHIGPFRLPRFLQRSDESNTLTDQLNQARTFARISELAKNITDIPLQETLYAMQTETADAAFEKIRHYERDAYRGYDRSAETLTSESPYTDGKSYPLAYVYSALLRRTLIQGMEKNIDDFRECIQPLGPDATYRYYKKSKAGDAITALLRSIEDNNRFTMRQLFEGGPGPALAAAKEDEVRAVLGSDAVDETIRELHRVMLGRLYHFDVGSDISRNMVKTITPFHDHESMGAFVALSLMKDAAWNYPQSAGEEIVSALGEIPDNEHETYDQRIQRVIDALRNDPTIFKRTIENPQLAEFKDEMRTDPQFIIEVAASLEFSPIREIVLGTSQYDNFYEKTGVYTMSEKAARDVYGEAFDPSVFPLRKGSSDFDQHFLRTTEHILGKNDIQAGKIHEDTIGFEHHPHTYKEFIRVPPERMAYYLSKHGYPDTLFDPANGKVPNPAFEHAASLIVSYAVDQIESGDVNSDKTRFWCNVIEKLDAPLGQKELSALSRVIRESTQEKSKKSAEQALMSRVRVGDSTALAVVADLIPQFSDAVFSSIPIGDLLKNLTESALTELDENQAYFFLHTLLRTDDVLADADISSLVTQDYRKNFEHAMQRFCTELSDASGSILGFEQYVRSPHVLRFIARQPHKIEEVLQWPQMTPNLFEHFKPGGLLAHNIDQVTRDIFSNGDFLRRARETEQFLTSYVPYWKFLFFYTDRRLGGELASAVSRYPVSHLEGKPLKRLGIRRLEAMVREPHVARDVHDGTVDSIPFSMFHGTYKRIIFRDYLRRTVETSRSDSAKAHADRRNRRMASPTLSLEGNTYVHASAVDNISSMLLNGNLPQEALGESAGKDSYPFHIDFSHIASAPTGQSSVGDRLKGSYSRSHGVVGRFGEKGQLYYLYDRTSAHGWEAGKEYHAGEENGAPDRRHALVLGGIPSTEISGIVVAVPEQSLALAREAVMEHGCYIPLYDMDGRMLFSPQEYDAARAENNMSVPVEVWDYSQKIGEARGSNPGGTFAVQTQEGLKRYYVKMRPPQEAEQMWSEQLAELIYRELGIPVAHTRIVRVEGSTGHASELLPEDADQNRDQLKNGFLADALLANWDIAKSDNSLMSNGVLYRIDNGGALLYRAQGERKEAAKFSGTVGELETLAYAYPNVTRDDISAQLAVLKERCTDSAIDRLVDSVRLAGSDRDFLKRTLRERREYIINHFEGERHAQKPEQKDATLETLLSGEYLDDEEIIRHVPEWSHLVGESGYQHNGVLLGGHIKEAIVAVKALPEFDGLSEDEKRLALVATFFHDFGKPTGSASEPVVRDFDHELPSAQIAGRYMKQWGYSDDDTRHVVQTILYDGVASDIARGKVRDQSKNMSPQEFARALDYNPATLRILRAVNRADVVATVGAGRFGEIERAYNAFFDAALEARSL
ncbi:hypothetical protein HY732_02445 [Candidatus Uhrbacteria bacterium]|nr:hypothetical protein [Candidatus Uhrbacteria bacterium]